MLSVVVISDTGVVGILYAVIKVGVARWLRNCPKLCAFYFGFYGVFENSVCFFLKIATKNTNAIIKMLVLA